ncbi:hypothetical protein GCM10027589_42910 [Actinocorallia lasiicapitis]
MAMVSAHRRDSDDEPAALARALAAGVDYVELDIRRGPTGDLLVRHDPLTGDPCTSVQDALKILQGRARAHLDLKEEGHELDLVALADEIMGRGNYVVTTKSAASIALIKRTRPDVLCALSIGRSLWQRGFLSDVFRPVARLRASGADWVALNYRLAYLGVLARCHRAGYPAMLWTVNTPRSLRRFLHDPRVTVLITDHPTTALTLR